MKKIYSLLLISVFSICAASAQIPVANFVYQDTAQCLGSCASIINQSTNATAWEWIFPGATPSSSSKQSPGNVCYFTSGTYDVTLIAINGSNRDTLTRSNYIRIFPDPVIPVITRSGNMLYCSTDTSYISYQWYFNTTPVPGGTHSALAIALPGNYNVAVTNSNACGISVGINVTGTFLHNSLYGNCFIDYNGNHARDGGEPGYDNGVVLSVGSTQTWFGFPDTIGSYLVGIADSGVVQTTFKNNSPYYTVSPSQHTSNFAGLGQADSVDFAIVPVPGIRDLRISLIPLSFPRLGNDVIYRVEYSNVGTDTVTAGTVYLIKDSRMPFLWADTTNDILSGDSIGWNYTMLLPNETRTVEVGLHIPIPPDVNGGDILSFKAYIEPSNTDSTPANNVVYINQTARSSYDPNDKTCLLGNEITLNQVAEGQELPWLIRFQNTGNDTAFKIVIRDTLDSHLDVSTFHVLSSSNAYEASINNQHVITFTFNNILLPDSNVNEPASNGYICYSIKPENTVGNGDIIKNTAHIYFDYNPPVATNTAIVNVTFPSHANEIRGDVYGISIFPNPAANQIFVSSSFPRNEVATLSVMNMLGQEAMSYSLSFARPDEHPFGRGEGRGEAIDVSKLPAGMYFLQLKGERGSVVKRFVKK